VADPEEAAQTAARLLVDAAEAGRHIALAGGSTPRHAYELAAGLQPDWSRVALWWSDERCVPPWDARSNFRLAREALLDRLGRTPESIHRIQGELGPARAASQYEEELGAARLGFVLLGIGSDGHTASLFPRSPALEESSRLALPVEQADVDRVTLTLPALRAAGTVVFFAVGGEKADAVRRAFALPPDAATPASLVRGTERTVAVLDLAAAGNLP
jgi:6-phosphogluconolactonase